MRYVRPGTSLRSMSPRSLLFSSYEETSRLLIQALKELELEVEHCPEIFGALEQLTGRGFDVIVADLDNGPEAGFLLKTASELTLNKGALAVTVSSRSAKVAQGISADVMLTRLISSDQVKYALLNCDRFLAQMRVWLAKPDTGTVQERAALSIPKELLPAPPPRSARIEPAARPAKPSPLPRKSTLGTAVPSTLLSARPPAPVKREILRSPVVTKPIVLQRSSVQAKAKPDHARFRWATSIAITSLALLCGFIGPGQIKRASGPMAIAVRQVLEKTYERASAIKEKLGRPSNVKKVDSAGVAQAATSHFPIPGITRASGVRVFPVHRSSIPGQSTSAGAEKLQAELNPGQQRLSADTLGMQIPKSIELPQPELEPLHSIAKGPNKSLLSELQPINLPEDLSAQLLVEKVQPSYPEQALKIGLQGVVVLQAWIGQDGTIRDLKLVRGSLLLGQSAYHAVKQWRYKPCIRDGRAVEAMTYVTVNFTLPSQSLLSPYPHRNSTVPVP